MKYERSVSPEPFERMVAAVHPDWSVLEATPADWGHDVVHDLELQANGGEQACVLEVTPPERRPTRGDETRILPIPGRHTPLAVPEVLGVVEDRPRFS